MTCIYIGTSVEKKDKKSDLEFIKKKKKRNTSCYWYSIKFNTYDKSQIFFTRKKKGYKSITPTAYNWNVSDKSQFNFTRHKGIQIFLTKKLLI